MAIMSEIIIEVFYFPKQGISCIECHLNHGSRHIPPLQRGVLVAETVLL